MSCPSSADRVGYARTRLIPMLRKYCLPATSAADKLLKINMIIDAKLWSVLLMRDRRHVTEDEIPGTTEIARQ